MSKVAYTAVVLEPFYVTWLAGIVKPLLGEGFETQTSRGQRLPHHFTVCMGCCPGELKDQLGKTKVLTIDAWGKSDKAAALRLTPFSVKEAKLSCKNDTPHITVAINSGNGGSPKDSNDITEWTEFEQSMGVRGVLEEVSH